MKQYIAPCGINCTLCIAFQRTKDKCGGCGGPDSTKTYHCKVCAIRNCELLAGTDSGFCYSCPKFPCVRIKRLDMGYRKKYGMSIIENLQVIMVYGPEEFAAMEAAKWKCGACGAILCVHKPTCPACGEANKFYPEN